VDPGWNGPLATALVNFSNTNFEIERGAAFLRVLFMLHAKTSAKDILMDRKTYMGQIRDKSSKIPSTFLDLKSLANEVLNQIYGSSVFANWLTRVGIIIGLIAIVAIFIPTAYGVSSEFMSRKADVVKMQEDIAKITTRQIELQNQQQALELKIVKITH
jgi:hypothetical protein